MSDRADVQPHTEPADDDARLAQIREMDEYEILDLLDRTAEQGEGVEARAEILRLQRDALQERIDRVIAFRNDTLDTSQSPWLGKEIVSALDVALRP